MGLTEDTPSQLDVRRPRKLLLSPELKVLSPRHLPQVEERAQPYVWHKVALLHIGIGIPILHR